MPFKRKRLAIHSRMGKRVRYSPYRAKGLTGLCGTRKTIQELKFFDAEKGTPVALTAPGGMIGGEHPPDTANQTLNTVVQDDTATGRDGRQICMKNITVKGIIVSAAQTGQTAADLVPKILVALVLDTQTNGAVLSSEDVFTNPSGVGSLACSPFRNLAFAKRFQVLDQAVFSLDDPEISFDGTTIVQHGQHKAFTLYANLNNMITNYSLVTGVVAAITDNSLQIVAFCSNVSLNPTIIYNSRLRFTS